MAILSAVLLMPGPTGALTTLQQPSFMMSITLDKFKKIDLDFVLELA